jgi:hypothetical protein
LLSRVLLRTICFNISNNEEIKKESHENESDFILISIHYLSVSSQFGCSFFLFTTELKIKPTTFNILLKSLTTRPNLMKLNCSFFVSPP